MIRITRGRLYSASLVVGLLAALVVAGAQRTAPASPWIGLLDAEGTEVVFALNPASCDLTGPEIRDLNEFAASSPIPFRVVFLNPPADAQAREGIVNLFSLDMPTSFDDQDEWSRPLLPLRFKGGAVVLARAGMPIAITDLDEWLKTTLTR